MKQPQPPTVEDARLLTRAQVADLLGLSPDTLDRWACQGKGPRFTRFSPREVRYRLADVLAWESLLEAVEPREIGFAPRAMKRRPTK